MSKYDVIIPARNACRLWPPAPGKLAMILLGRGALATEFLNGLGAQFGAWEKFESKDAGITGYSLGGSLASMASVYLTKKQLVDKNLIRLVTFGEPRTGNVAYAKDVEENVAFRYRIVKRNDFFASIPRSADPTTSLVTATNFERQPLFYRFLVHYDNSMKKGSDFKICGLSDDFGCRNTLLASDLFDHTSYFNIDVTNFNSQRCPREMLF
ncbi:hypothetical protein KIN20_028203 [Parelaphostrongylus tenuis]|uniref:Fungal lipase-type domain-containing protein n=1 Tax=Parelaphostrongylus tenuis TaxID=148309 RepID=A0AAD5WEK4_PARTN|nr:hypothetical protein KIN20_028203 [Parelaphostrongylus tenuis]